MSESLIMLGRHIRAFVLTLLVVYPISTLGLAQTGETGGEAAVASDALSATPNFRDLVDRTGFKIDTVVEGLEPLPIYCVAFEPVEFPSREARVAAAQSIDLYFRERGTPWYDLVSQGEWWMLSELAAIDEGVSRFTSLFNLKIEGVDVHILPVPAMEIELTPIHDIDDPDYNPPSTLALLLEDYGFRIVFIEEETTLLGPEAKVLLRRTKILDETQRRSIKRRVDDYLNDHPDGWSWAYLFDRIFLNTLMGIEEGFMELSSAQGLELHDVIVHVSWIPMVSTRARLVGESMVGYPPPPCA